MTNLKSFKNILAVETEVPVNFVKYSPDAVIPTYAHLGDSGMDLRSVEEVRIPPGQRALVKTGLGIELPVGTEAQVRSKSGMAINFGVMVLNSPGTVDSSYRGEIGVILYNTHTEPYYISVKDKIAQLVICPVLKAQISYTLAPMMEDTSRGKGAYGSTGMK